MVFLMRALPRWQISRFLTSFLIITREIEYQSVNSNSYVLICGFVGRNKKVILWKIMSELRPLGRWFVPAKNRSYNWDEEEKSFKCSNLKML